VYAVNDGAVMKAWAKDQKIEGSMITFMGDPKRDLTTKLGMELDHPGPNGDGLWGRCKRHCLYVVDGIVKVVTIAEAEDDPAGDDDPEDTLAPAVLEMIAKVS
jgi:peroxiredoxin